MAAPIALTYLFDPLCGWCYGAAPMLEWLAARPEVTLDLAPTGLFAGAGARSMDAGFAAHAWANDMRIGKLTGQGFSAAYRRDILGDPAGRFDSGPATLALTAVAATAPAQELAALKAIQAARYQAGRDITDPATLAALLQGLGLTAAATFLAAPEPALLAANAARIAAAQQAMQRFGARGVPTLLAGQGAAQRLVPGDSLFGPAEPLLAALLAA